MTEFSRQTDGAISQREGNTNRGRDIATTSQNAPQLKVTLEKINEIIANYFESIITPTIDDNGTSHPVNVMYGTPERWATVRQFGGIRDEQNDKLVAPLIMLRRVSERPGKIINPNNKYVYRSVTTDWNRRNAYDRFAVQNNIRPSRQIRYIMTPDYMDLTYDVVLWTDFQSQMDTLIEQINVENHEFWGQRNNFKFRVSIEEFAGENELPATENRVVRSRFSMIVAAYLLPERALRNFKIAATTEDKFSPKKIVVTEEVVSDVSTLKI